MKEFSRRRFLDRCSKAGLAAWLGAELAFEAAAEPRWPAGADSSTARGILRVRLSAPRLDAMGDFYGRAMGWKVSWDGGSLRIRAGGTELLFDPASEGEAPVYHIAWAIPSNRFEAAKAWLAERTDLLRHPDGRDEFHFRTANRSAVYFADPADNVLELIARHELGDTAKGPFGLDDLLYVNHVGLVVGDMDSAIRTLRSELSLEPIAPPTPSFTTLGDSHRHVVLVPEGRLWLPEMSRGAAIFPTDLALHGPGKSAVQLTDLPYRVAIES